MRQIDLTYQPQQQFARHPKTSHLVFSKKKQAPQTGSYLYMDMTIRGGLLKSSSN